MGGPPDAIFERVARLADRSPSLADLGHHRLQLCAAAGLRSRGLPMPPGIVDQERTAAVAALTAPSVLARVREAVDGPLLLIKGPDVARYYPDALMRRFRDLDVIVPDAAATQRQLLAAGFVEVGDPELYEDIHHLRPVRAPGLPLVVEVHHTVKWVDGLTPPGADELIGAAAPAAAGVEDVLALPPAHHSLVLAAHGWAHRPLGRIGDLLDIALVAHHARDAELDRLARTWGLTRVWRTTARAIDALFGDGPRPVALALWARHLAQVRERTVLEAHLQSWLSPLWGLPHGPAVAATLERIRGDLLPDDGEDWRSKRGRVRAAVTNAFVRKSQHDKGLASMTGGR
jgi:Uncharacterised nucleotidyltransferase